MFTVNSLTFMCYGCSQDYSLLNKEIFSKCEEMVKENCPASKVYKFSVGDLYNYKPWVSITMGKRFFRVQSTLWPKIKTIAMNLTVVSLEVQGGSKQEFYVLKGARYTYLQEVHSVIR